MVLTLEAAVAVLEQVPITLKSYCRETGSPRALALGNSQLLRNITANRKFSNKKTDEYLASEN